MDLLTKGVRLIREGKAPRIPQDLTQSTYNHPYGLQEATIDWAAPTQQIYNAIRASEAWPGARTTLRGGTLKIWQAKKIDAVPSVSPGTIFEISENGICVRTGDGAIRIERLQLDDGPKLSFKDFIQQVSTNINDKLG